MACRISIAPWNSWDARSFQPFTNSLSADRQLDRSGLQFCENQYAASQIWISGRRADRQLRNTHKKHFMKRSRPSSSTKRKRDCFERCLDAPAMAVRQSPRSFWSHRPAMMLGGAQLGSSLPVPSRSHLPPKSCQISLHYGSYGTSCHRRYESRRIHAQYLLLVFFGDLRVSQLLERRWGADLLEFLHPVMKY